MGNEEEEVVETETIVDDERLMSANSMADWSVFHNLSGTFAPPPTRWHRICSWFTVRWIRVRDWRDIA